MQAAINDALGGYQVVPAMDHECSHANLQVPLHPVSLNICDVDIMSNFSQSL